MKTEGMASEGERTWHNRWYGSWGVNRGREVGEPLNVRLKSKGKRIHMEMRGSGEV